MGAYQTFIHTRNISSQQSAQQPITLGNIGTVLTSTVHDFPERLGQAISGLGEDVLNVPIAPGLSLIEFYKATISSDTDQLTSALEKITGINITETFNQFTLPTTANIDARLREYAIGIKEQIIREIRECIEKHLRSIIAINPVLRIIFDPLGALAREIAEIRLRIQRKIISELEKLIYKRIKIQQVSIFRQRILQGIRSICPSTGVEKRQRNRRPTIERNFYLDKTWSDSTSLPYANSTNNLNTQMNVATDLAVDHILNDVKSQITSTSNKSIDTFFSSDGVPV